MHTDQEVTIDRIINVMQRYGVELHNDRSGRVAQAQLNDFHVLFVLLDSVLIIRADAGTEIPSETPDATLYLAANQVNSSVLNARAIIGNRDRTLIVRTEAELAIGAGMNDNQLSSAVKRAVDQVIFAQDAMKTLADSIKEQRAASFGN